MGDEEIIGLFFARSEQAIGETDRKYGAGLRAFSLRILGDRRDMEECVNDTYLGVWNAIPPARPNPFPAFLYRIARNLSLKRYHRNRAARRNSTYTVALEELDHCLAGPETAEGEVEARELADLIQDFLDTLEPENRGIFLRRYWFADSHRDISVRTGLSEKAVSVRLTRLRQKLRTYLQERGVLV